MIRREECAAECPEECDGGTHPPARCPCGELANERGELCDFCEDEERFAQAEEADYQREISRTSTRWP